MKKMKKSGILTLVVLLLAAMLLFGPFGGEERYPSANSSLVSLESVESVAQSTDEHEDTAEDTSAEPSAEALIDEHGVYDSKEEVALYIHTYGTLPSNYVTKKEAEAAGWSGGSVEKYLPGKCIGGSRFGNYEGLLPDKDGRQWTECDIGTLGKSSRGAERIVFSNDGLIYYTGDHYESFELLYGEP